MLENLTKKITAAIPGTNLSIAQAKRKMEKDLRRAKGYSRSHAVALVGEYFKNNLQGVQK